MDNREQCNGQVSIQRAQALGALRVLGQLDLVERSMGDVQDREDWLPFLVADRGGDAAGNTVLVASRGEDIADGGLVAQRANVDGRLQGVFALAPADFLLHRPAGEGADLLQRVDSELHQCLTQLS